MKTNYNYPELSLPTAMSESFANGTRAKTVRIWIEELDPTPEFIQWVLDTHTDAQWWKDNMSKLRGSDDWEMMEELAAEWQPAESTEATETDGTDVEETNEAKTYTVILNHWQDGSGWSHSETFDRIDEACTAEEYLRSLDEQLKPPVGCDNFRCEVYDEDGHCISKCWASDVYEQ